jgi:hypothetical protein
MKGRIFASLHEPALLAIGAAILWAQLLAPPFIWTRRQRRFREGRGLVLHRSEERATNFVYFISDYVRSSRYHWESQTYSTGAPLAWLAKRLAGARNEGDPFDIRWLGAVHGILFLGALYLLIRLLRPLAPWRRWLIPGAAIFIFTDAGYVAYFNSFYTDTAALLGLLLTVVLGIDLAVNGVRRVSLMLFCLAALLFIGSKPQHAIWGFLPAGALALTGLRCGLIGGVVLMAASVFTLGSSPPNYTAAPLFTLLFSKLARESPAPGQVLTELGLPEQDVAFVGMNAFQPEAPVNDPRWLHDFEFHVNYRAVLTWYLRHPVRTLGFLNEALKIETFQMRPENLSNFRREDGHPPGARTDRFALWSNFRRALFLKWPYHILAWYLLVIVAAIRTPAPLRWMILGIIVLAAGEFCVASLADAAETSRHLFIFHACTDLTVCFGIAAVVSPDKLKV